MKAQFNM